ncbi:membrane protein required for colicin V production [Methylorubrum rhodinum]|jgi:membrane protein required for colicin V production|uniref:Membrane protein required for colicin V production n=1 Tax=Methylorubrum rhodinum TaxID=29428 RepID=A0A840ZI02_9HYPH|nr:CvpA family protein [Methylorubrum rhodinum]MBB5757529.1 membrane protein required for colicin V production [Methylorubrum rhodinum]
MPFSVLDLVVLGIVLVSALLAAVRGVTREVLAIIAWVAAAALAWSLHPMLLPTVKQHVSSDTVALVASIGAIFLATLIVVSLITVKVSDLVLDSRIGAVDRSLGFVFGAGRGFLICVIGWVFLAWLVQGKVPDWAAQAKSKPLLESSGEALVAQLPDNPEGFLKQLRKPKDAPAEEPPPETDLPAQRRSDAGPAAPAPKR